MNLQDYTIIINHEHNYNNLRASQCSPKLMLLYLCDVNKGIKCFIIVPNKESTKSSKISFNYVDVGTREMYKMYRRQTNCNK